MFLQKTSQKKRVSCLLLLSSVVGCLQGNEVDLQQIVSASSCFLLGDHKVVISYIIDPPNASLFYVKCFHLSRSSKLEKWKHSYTFLLAKLGSSRQNVFKISKRYSHTWHPENGTFSLLVENPEATWYRCDFEGAGKHRHMRSYTEIDPIQSGPALSSHLFPKETVFEFHKRRDKQLRGIVGGSGCIQPGARRVQLTWKVIPVKASLFSVKCYQTDNPKAAWRDRLFTYQFETKRLDKTESAKRENLSFQWKQGLGELSIKIPSPSRQDDGKWFMCNFNGAGRHRHRKAYIQLKYETSGTHIMSTTSPVVTFEQQTSYRDSVGDPANKRTKDGNDETSGSIQRSAKATFVLYISLSIIYFL